ncbi:hypothetical protein GWK36_14390 [Caldichromatium japonicum]|uniref:Uncharacterized protein n=1 Tax=Caldichromatium japonicum TaxID=2699430 RepID=A0A6G7VGI1_9GAMM|nr:hypothetical protein [Caldichromatium japonicum]QIK38986.1 hypothetical protein GWK36_14390 [Caldichromatium japonicum]
MKIGSRLLLGAIALAILCLAILWLTFDQAARDLQRRLDQIAARLQVGRSPFILSLPDRGGVFILFRQGDIGPSCAELIIKDGQVRLARIAGEPIALSFAQGIDLGRWDQALAACDRMSIGLTAQTGWMKGELRLSYQAGRITHIDPAYLWD